MRLSAIIKSALTATALAAGFLTASTGAAHATYSDCMNYVTSQTDLANKITDASAACAYGASPNPVDCEFSMGAFTSDPAKACKLAAVRP